MNDEIPLIDFDQRLPDSLLVTVILESKPGVTRWATLQWDALAVVVGERTTEPHDADEDSARRYFNGLKIALYVDEAESYYHNLMSPKPSCYVVARIDEEDMDDQMPVPVLVTLSFDQAHAYLEGDDTVFAVPLAPELYRWTEAYVLQHYAPEKKFKRKLVNWKGAQKH
ncbi:MAG: hypothetical protein ACI8P9_002869 [Parasphingorhabdus sp.]|jgi:hypothetical protein